MAERLRIGVIGLGRRWACQYRPALLELRDRFAVRSVVDCYPQRAAAAAREFGCPVAPGVLACLEGDLDAVLLLGRPWYRLWPLDRACRVGRPVYLGTSLAADEARADELVQQVRVANLPVMPELLPRLAPATERLRKLLPRLGPLRSAILTAERPGRGGGGDGALAAALALIDCCSAFLEGPPTATRSFGEPANGHAGWLIDFGGPVAHVLTWPGGRGRATVRIRLVGEKGTAEAILPRRVRWRISRASRTIMLPPGPPLVRLALHQFHDALTAGRPPTPGFDDAYQALTRLRLARPNEP